MWVASWLVISLFPYQKFSKSCQRFFFRKFHILIIISSFLKTISCFLTKTHHHFSHSHFNSPGLRTLTQFNLRCFYFRLFSYFLIWIQHFIHTQLYHTSFINLTTLLSPVTDIRNEVIILTNILHNCIRHSTYHPFLLPTKVFFSLSKTLSGLFL